MKNKSKLDASFKKQFKSDLDAAGNLILAAPDLLAALRTVLDQVDYTVGNCSASALPVGAVLDRRVIALARAAIAKATKSKSNDR